MYEGYQKTRISGGCLAIYCVGGVVGAFKISGIKIYISDKNVEK
jgi:hypothetical protein